MKLYPFKFLDSYDKDDISIFFGRETEIAELFQMVIQSPIVLVYGASGTGKTSLIQCGLSCRLQVHEWLPITIRRGSNINEALEKALDSLKVPVVSEDLEWLNEFTTTAVRSKEKESGSVIVERLNAIYRNEFKPIYLIFDQLEELFIFGSRLEQSMFIKTIEHIVSVQQPVKIIFSLREEYLGELSEFENVVPLLRQKKLRIESMGLDKAKEVMFGMTDQKKVSTNVSLKQDEKEEIAERIFKLVKGESKERGIQLTYLQVLLDKLYLTVTSDENRIKEAEINLGHIGSIEDIGNVLRSFLTDQVGKIYAKLTASYPKVTIDNIWQILSQFVTLKGTKDPISKETLFQKLQDFKTELLSEVVEELVSSRILRYSEVDNLYEIAHDTLGPTIASKRSAEEIAILEVRNLIESQSSFKGDARFFREEQMSFIESYLQKIKLTPAEQLLINESNREIQRRKGRKRRRFVIVTVSIAAASLILIGLYFKNVTQKKENKAMQEALLKERRVLDSLLGSQQKIQQQTQELTYKFKDDSVVYNDRLRNLTDSIDQQIQESQAKLKAMNSKLYYKDLNSLILYLKSPDYSSLGIEGFYRLVNSNKLDAKSRHDYFSAVRDSIAKSRDVMFGVRALFYLYNATGDSAFLNKTIYPYIESKLTKLDDKHLSEIDWATTLGDYQELTYSFRLKLFEKLAAASKQGSLSVRNDDSWLQFFTPYYAKAQDTLQLENGLIYLPREVLNLIDINTYFYAIDQALEIINTSPSDSYSIRYRLESLMKLNRLIALCKIAKACESTSYLTRYDISFLLEASFSDKEFFERLEVPRTTDSSVWATWELNHQDILDYNAEENLSRFKKEVTDYWKLNKKRVDISD